MPNTEHTLSSLKTCAFSGILSHWPSIYPGSQVRNPESPQTTPFLPTSNPAHILGILSPKSPKSAHVSPSLAVFTSTGMPGPAPAAQDLYNPITGYLAPTNHPLALQQKQSL